MNRRILLPAACFILLVLGGIFPIACGSNNSPTSPPAPTPVPTPAYSSTAVTVISGPTTFWPGGMNFFNGNLWIANFDDNDGVYSLDEFTAAGAAVTVLNTYNGSTSFSFLRDVKAGPDGTLYTADWANNQIEVFSSNGTYQTAITGLNQVISAAVNSSGTTLYEVQTTKVIQSYSIDNSTTPKTFTSTGSFSTTGSGAGALSVPQFLALDSNNNVYVSDEGVVPKIAKYGPTGASPVSFGSAGLTQPQGMVFDSAGNLLVAQYGGPCFIQEFNPSGGTYASGVTFGNGVLSGPRGLALDSSGNLYVGNSGRNQVLEFKKTN